MSGDKEIDMKMSRDIGSIIAKLENMADTQDGLRDDMRTAIREIRENINGIAIRVQILESERAKLIAIAGLVSTGIGFLGWAITNANAFERIFK